MYVYKSKIFFIRMKCSLMKHQELIEAKQICVWSLDITINIKSKLTIVSIAIQNFHSKFKPNTDKKYMH